MNSDLNLQQSEADFEEKRNNEIEALAQKKGVSEAEAAQIREDEYNDSIDFQND